MKESIAVSDDKCKRRQSVRLSVKVLITTVIIAAVLTLGYSFIRHTTPDRLALRTWFERNVGMILVMGWQIIAVSTAVVVFKQVFGNRVIRGARIVGRVLTVVICLIGLGVLGMVELGLLLNPDTEYVNDNGTITVSHAVWLDPATYSLWKSEGLLYRSYIRESAGREDIDPSESKDAFLRRNWPEMYEERTDLEKEAQEDHGNPVTVDAYDEQVEASKITDGLVAIYISDFSADPANSYRTYWSTHGDPEAIIYEDEQVIRYLRYDRISSNEECFLYVYYEAEKADDGSWSATDASILDMYAYVMDNGSVIASGKKGWADTGNEAYRTATGE